MTEIECISAVTLATHDMDRSVRFYQALGFKVDHGGPTAEFTTLLAGDNALNLIAVSKETPVAWWGRVIFYVSDVDAFFGAATAAGIQAEFSPRDASWGERYFHLLDPDGHELSFAVPLNR